MGLFDKIKDAKGKTLKSQGYMTGRQAREYAQATKMCKKGGCNDHPGGHSFKFPGARDYCKEHARAVQNERNSKAKAIEDAKTKAAEAKAKKAEQARKKAEEARKKKGK